MSDSNASCFLAAALASFMVLAPLSGHAKEGAPKVSVDTGAQAASAGAAASASAAVPLAHASDTIGEAADRQRTMRMLQSQVKPAGMPSAVPALDAKVPGIVVERAPDKAQGPGSQGGKPAEPPMILTEVMRGPTKLLAGIELNGVNRFVSVGEDIGNGWRVAGIDKYRVILTAPEPITGKAADKASKGKSKDAKPEEPKLKTMVLPLGMRTVAADQRN